MAQATGSLLARTRVLWSRSAFSVTLWLALSIVGLVVGLSLTLVSWSQAASSARFAVLAAATAVLVARVARSEPGVVKVWAWFTRAGMVSTLAAGADLVVRLVTGTGELGPYVFSVGVLVACLMLHQGMTLWNRSRTSTADPSDLLNGLGATLAVAAFGNLALIAQHGENWPGSWLSAQLHLLGLGAIFVLTGTAVTVSLLNPGARDVRIRLGLGAMLLALAGTLLSPSTGLLPESVTTSVLTAGRFSFSLGWMLLIVTLAGCALIPERQAVAKPATTKEISHGALLVMTGGLAVLLLATRLDPELTTAAVVLGALAILIAGTRSLHLIRDLTDLAIRKQEALTDDLTGLANRRAFTRALAGRPAGRSRAMLIIDLNDFKIINDRHGHAVGDQVLAFTAECLRRGTPPGGMTARLGGDEFAVLLPGTSSADALAVAWRLAESVERSDFDFSVGLSIGVASGDQTFGVGPSIDDDELLRRADAAMYVAKTSRVQVSLYDQDLDRRRREHNQLTLDLIAAFENAEADGGLPFEVYYQPQVSMRTGRVAGVEALVRWQHPERGLLPPSDFLDLLERNGRMGELTEFVVWSALRDTATWERTGLAPLRVSVNLSPVCLTDPAFPVMLQQIVGAGIDPSVITFEVTETTLMKDPERSMQMCGLIVEAGFGLSIDDYGTGYSSLAYLSDLPATELKIDRAFVSRIQHDTRVRAIVSGTVDLAHQLGLRIVAEGAEQSGTLGLLRELGCDEVQGYVYSPPLPAVQLYAWVMNQETVFNSR
ncbi:putative bifunctional diguanylate cyclase/phosphodiesterase [Kineosporia babensis]|uniref:Bifunctional diguanylate cyclase/phosphodiesterase n=1 Tax=Kineosporia babensis TaxID=499548 RepID=A0A9X1SUB3_9ACTN|nr:bifunctional diguanylate cyclase/phosphodiesterase [Kineosporia babensis]MCD5312762.1 bifunctional diguanylate cyclase/phosphodiesterase [Kineosporia babensis]